MKKKILVFLTIIILILFFGSVSFLLLKEVKAGSGDNVYGWAWSEKIGWISFNCNNPELSGPHCATSNYGVNVDPSGVFSGYAWAGGGENVDTSLVGTIGWISFNSADLINCPSGSCEAKLDLVSHEVSGWVRAYRAIEPQGQTLGGWDGWIKLRGIDQNGNPYGVSFNTSTDEFEGWAWAGSDSYEEAIIGWISFNCLDRSVCANSNYKVTSDLNQSPDKPTGLNESWGCCGGIPNVALRTGLILNWLYSDPEGDPQAEYEVWLDESSGFSNPKFNNVVDPGPCLGPDCSYVVNLASDYEGDWLDPPPLPGGLVWANTYWWKVRVKDSNGAWSDFSDPKSFLMPNRASPVVDFTPDPVSPQTGENVFFTDESKCYLSNDSKYDCDAGGSEITYEWDFDYTGIMDDVDPTKGDVVHVYSDLGPHTIRLEITDDGVGLGPGTCYKEETIELKLPLPVWKEVIPF